MRYFLNAFRFTAARGRDSGSNPIRSCELGTTRERADRQGAEAAVTIGLYEGWRLDRGQESLMRLATTDIHR